MSEVILVTGCSSGFGERVAKTLAAGGHTVFASMRAVRGHNAAAARNLRKWADETAANLMVIGLDVTKEASVRRAVAKVVAKTGRIDVVVNNAGIMNIGVNEAFSPEDMQRIFGVNVLGPFRVNAAVLPYMRRQRRGLLVHITSTVGRILFPFIGIYAASKFALEALAESYRYEVARLGIESVIVEPGPFPTALAEKGVRPGRAEVQREYPALQKDLERLGQVFAEMFSAENPPDPQTVADAVARIVDLPPGQRPVRTVVDPLFGESIAELNRIAAKVQAHVLNTMKLKDLETQIT